MFFEQLRDKEVIGAMLAEVAGKNVADANLTATAKFKKQIIRNGIEGTNGGEARAWLPKWLQPGDRPYTDRGSIWLTKHADRGIDWGAFDDCEGEGATRKSRTRIRSEALSPLSSPGRASSSD